LKKERGAQARKKDTLKASKSGGPAKGREGGIGNSENCVKKPPQSSQTQKKKKKREGEKK